MPQNLDNLSPVQFFRRLTEPPPTEQPVPKKQHATDELAYEVPVNSSSPHIPRDGGDEILGDNFPDL